MSRVIVPSGEQVTVRPRKMTPARRRRLLEAADGCCEVVGCDCTSGLEIDHRTPLELGGSDGDENLWAICRAHHVEKTREDIRMIAKARRIRKKLSGDVRPKRPIPSRPLSGGGKLQSRGFPKRD